MDLREKCILVTGSGGFLGRHLVRHLQDRGCDQVWNPGRDAFDLRHQSDVAGMLGNIRPQVIIHCAARCGGIGANRQRPAEFLRDNLLMGVNLIHECHRAAVEKLILIGTCCSFPKFTPVPFREESLWDGYPEETNAPYGLAKRLVLEAGRAYHQQYGLNVVNLILANLYGPGDNFDLDTSHVIPAMIRKMTEAKERGESTVTLWGTGQPEREFLYVEDAARAIVMAAEKLDTPEPVNIGTGLSFRIAGLAVIIAALVGFRGEIVWDATHPNGQMQRRLDTTRARDWLGFQARVMLEEGLRQTVDGYRAQRAGG